MTNSLRRLYRRVRSAGIVGFAGASAIGSLVVAREMDRWNHLKSRGLVRIVLTPETDPDFSYLDTWDHLSERSKREHIERMENLGVYVVSGQYRLDDDSPWITADSIGNTAGYRDASDPFENPYVPDIISNTLAVMKDALRNRFCDKCGHRLSA